MAQLRAVSTRRGKRRALNDLSLRGLDCFAAGASSGLYSILGPYTFAAELQAGRLCASRLVKPDLVRHITLALSKALTRQELAA